MMSVVVWPKQVHDIVPVKRAATRPRVAAILLMRRYPRAADVTRNGSLSNCVAVSPTLSSSGSVMT